MGKDATMIPDVVQPLLVRIAGQLSDEIFPGGMPWGTKFDHLETLAGALGDEIARQLIQTTVSQQANTSREWTGTCPTCGREGRATHDEPRELVTTQGTVAWVESAQHCPHCRRAFFPSEPSVGTGPYRR
jgi:phage terminase large subunit GpA-like protein